MTNKNTTMEATEREIKSWFIWIRFVAEYQFKRNRKCMHYIHLPRNEGLKAQETTRCFFPFFLTVPLLFYQFHSAF